MTTQHALYSQLPATDRLLRDARLTAVIARFGHSRTVDILRLLQDEARAGIRADNRLPAWCDDWAQETEKRLAIADAPGLRPVINLTGTVLHTNLGRALLAQEAVEAVTQAMQTPVTLGRCRRRLPWSTILTAPGAAIAIGRWRRCCASSQVRKMPAL